MRWLVGLILASVPAFGQQQQNLQPMAYRDFSGGYVDYVDPAQLKPNESPDMLNVVVDNPVGSIHPRKGFALCGNLPSGNVPTNIFEYAKSDGTRRLIATDNQTVYTTPDCQTWTTIVSGLQASAQVYFATVRDKLWIVDGSTWPITWDGTTATPLDGRANTPNPQPGKCSYIEFWKERVWCGAPNGDPSGVQFSDITDSSGNDLDPSTGTLSWPASNDFEIDQNAGSRLYGLKAYRNRLYAFKDNGIWEIGFENNFNNFVRKTYATVGTRYQSSIVEADGILYFVGKDGIYAFDGDNAQRISTKIQNRFNALNQPLISQNYKIWTTENDFAGGTLIQADTSTAPGSVLISTFSAIPASVNADFETGDATNWTLALSGSGSSSNGCTGDEAFTNAISVGADTSIHGSYALHIRTLSSEYDNGVCDTPEDGQGCDSASLVYSILDGNGTVLLGPNTLSGTTSVDLSSLTTDYIRVKVEGKRTYEGGPFCLNTTADNVATMQSGFIRATHLTIRSAAADITVAAHPNRTYGTDYVVDYITNDDAYYSSATWTSEIYNTVAVSTWGPLLATDDHNSGNVTYAVRYGTNTGAVQQMAFASITPGSLIPANTGQTYIQVKATLTSSADQIKTPNLDDVTISWNNGGNNTQKIFSGQWENALWVSASSGSATTNNIVLRRAKAPLDAWEPMDLQIGPMAHFNDLFYAGSSTSSAIYRMDYGTNDNGAAIGWFWESRDENWGLPNNAKYLQELDTDFRNNAACNIRIGYVQDQNTQYCVGNTPAPNANLTNGVGSRRLNFNGGPAYTYRFKVCDDQKDQTPTIIGLTGWARTIQRRGD